MPEIELSAGTIDYEDTGGAGPTIVLLPGLMMDASLWEPADATRCGHSRIRGGRARGSWG